MTVTVEGTLAFPAEKRTEVLGNRAVVVLLIDLGHAYRFEARLNFNQDHARAEAVAVALGRGNLIRVQSKGCFPRVDHGHAALVMSNVSAAVVDGRAVYP